MDSFNQILNAVKDSCKASLPDATYNAFISPLGPVSFDGDKAVLSVTSDWLKNFVTNRYVSLIKSGFETVIGFQPEIEIITLTEEPEEKSPVRTQMVSPVKTAGFEKNYTFDNFVKGSDNEFALAASLAVADDPANSWNPLFIHGASGLGKTHLLLAIKNQLEKTRPELKVLYIGCEAFTNDLIQAIRTNTTDSFHDKYRKVDVLLVDDVQFLAGKESTQEEFFYTFNALHEAHKQIVLASDRPPKEIQALEDRLRNRFEWGLMADVKPPNMETRISIIYSKSEELGFTVSKEVAEYIAKQLKTDVRQLEGAVKKIYAFTLLNGDEPNLDTAQKAIEDIVNETQPWPTTIERIISEVARTYNVSGEDLRGPKQKSEISNARQIAMYIIREVTGATMEKVGEEFSRNHATVVYAISKVESIMSTDSRTKAVIQDIIKNCQI